MANFLSRFLFGSPEKHKRVPTLLPGQMPLANQLFQAGRGRGAGGAFGEAADYYRDLLSNDSETFDQMFAPEMRRFNQQIMPQLAEQYAGMGSGGLQSSGFRNAASQAGTDLSERLAALRASLRSQGAAGLSGLGQAGLGNYSQDVVTRPGSQGAIGGLAEAAIPLLTGVLGSSFGGGFGGPLAYQAGSWMNNNRGMMARDNQSAVRNKVYGGSRGGSMSGYRQNDYGMY